MKALKKTNVKKAQTVIAFYCPCPDPGGCHDTFIAYDRGGTAGSFV